MARHRTPATATPLKAPAILAAIDVGTNAVRLEMVRALANPTLGTAASDFEIVHQERDPLRPGEGVFRTGSIPREVADRLLSTLRRYAALCRRFQATVRAVATSAVREAGNREEIVRRARREAGLELEVVSGREEARLIALGVLHGKPPRQRSLIVDIGGGSTEIATAIGERPLSLFSVAVGAVRLTEIFADGKLPGKVHGKQLTLIRRFAEEAFAEALPTRLPGQEGQQTALGSSGTIAALVGYAGAPGSGHATLAEVERAVQTLAGLTLAQRRQRFDGRRAEIVVAGAAILAALMRHLNLRSISPVDRGLRDGLIVDLLNRAHPNPRDHSLTNAALALGQRFDFDEKHARQVTRLALTLFDDLGDLHRLPAAARPILEVAALLHDLGSAVSYQRHHKHSYYLIQNADIPGLTERERELAARVARYHRRSPPERSHLGTAGLSDAEFDWVRQLSTLLRVADSLDRSHRQPVRRLHAAVEGGRVRVALTARGPLDLELWDAESEKPLFRRVFGKRVELERRRAAGSA